MRSSCGLNLHRAVGRVLESRVGQGPKFVQDVVHCCLQLSLVHTSLMLVSKDGDSPSL